MKITLSDWQTDKFRDPEQPESLEAEIAVAADRVTLEAGDGRMISIELQNGSLRLLAHEGREGKEHPVVVSIPARGDILVEMADYAREARPAPDLPDTPEA